MEGWTARDNQEDLRPDEEILEVLSPENLVGAYCQGIFPMVQDGELLWFRPDPRGVLPLDERFHLPRRLQRAIRSGRLVCTRDRCFDEVVRLCSRNDQPDQMWISPEIRLAYHRLHELGLAHSIEAWPADAVGAGSPVGGLYGVALRGAFFAESMFHTVTDAGKVALSHLVETLRAGGFQLCDVQWTTPNLARFGTHDIPGREYLKRLARALRRDAVWA